MSIRVILEFDIDETGADSLDDVIESLTSNAGISVVHLCQKHDVASNVSIVADWRSGASLLNNYLADRAG